MAAVGRAVLQWAKRVGKVAMPDDPKDVIEAAEKIRQLLRWLMGKGDGNRNPPVPSEIVSDTNTADDVNEAIQSKKLKALKFLIAAGAVYGVHKLDMAARHRIAEQIETGEGLLVAISDLPAVPLPTALTRTCGLEPRAVAVACINLVGDVPAGLIGYANNVNDELPHAFPAPSERFDPTGFLLAILLPFLQSLFED